MALGTIPMLEDSAKGARRQKLVYFVRRESDGWIKIGFSGRLRSRLCKLARDFGPIAWLGVIPGGRDLEKEMHKRFDAYQADGEWFFPTKELKRFISDSTYAPEFLRKLEGPQCEALAQGGWRCQRPANPGGYCHIHETQLSNGKGQPV